MRKIVMLVFTVIMVISCGRKNSVIAKESATHKSVIEDIRYWGGTCYALTITDTNEDVIIDSEDVFYFKIGDSIEYEKVVSPNNENQYILKPIKNGRN